jgi:hypothetical protein
MLVLDLGEVVDSFNIIPNGLSWQWNPLKWFTSMKLWLSIFRSSILLSAGSTLQSLGWHGDLG